MTETKEGKNRYNPRELEVNILMLLLDSPASRAWLSEKLYGDRKKEGRFTRRALPRLEKIGIIYEEECGGEACEVYYSCQGIRQPKRGRPSAKELSKKRKRTGPKTKCLKIYKDLATLHKLWRDYPDLKEKIFGSSYYRSLLPELLNEVYYLTFDILWHKPTTLEAEVKELIREALKELRTFADLVITQRLADIIRLNLAAIEFMKEELPNNTELILKFREEDRKGDVRKDHEALVKEHEIAKVHEIHNILFLIIKACAVLDHKPSIVKKIEKAQYYLALIRGAEVMAMLMEELPKIKEAISQVKSRLISSWAYQLPPPPYTPKPLYERYISNPENFEYP